VYYFLASLADFLAGSEELPPATTRVAPAGRFCTLLLVVTNVIVGELFLVIPPLLDRRGRGDSGPLDS